ncbi:helix-turn-helix domain-containing protein [bacterium]|nr:helix-turn-helix domain-containing protein [bacterium]
MPGGTPNYRTVVLEDESLRSLQGFTQIPNVVLKHWKISFGAKVAYGVLLSYAWTDDFCFPAQERLAKDLNCSIRQVQRLLNELKEHGLIAWKQQGLNRPNIYYLLPISRWNTRSSKSNPDTTDLSSPDATDSTRPDATDQSRLEATHSSPKQYTKKNTHKIVNRSGNDHRHPVGDRPSAPRRSQTISTRVLKAKYHLSDEQIGRVHWLVEKQAETLGAGDRNHANYVKRAAEAVRDGHDNVLDRLLGEFKQASKELAVGNPPGYFHAMYTDTLSQTRSVALDDNTRPKKTPGPDDGRERMIADAESRGITIPDFIRQADTSAVRQWWAGVIDAATT